MKKTLLLLLLVFPVFVQAQTYTLNYDSVRVGKTPNSSVLIPKDIYLKGLPKGNVSIRADGKLIHNDTPYVKPTDLTIYKRKDDSTGADGYLRRGSLYPLSDQRYQTLSNLDTNSVFGNSDILYPSQKAVKRFVEVSARKSPAGYVNFFGKTIWLFGDSVGAGSTATGSAFYWSNVAAQGLGASITNMSTSGSTLEKRSPINPFTGANMVDKIASIPTKTATIAQVIYALGVNDFGVNSANYTTANYITDYHTVIDATLAKGFTVSDITIMSPYYVTQTGFNYYNTISGNPAPNRARLVAFVAAAKQVADYYGVNYLDIYSAQLRNDTTLYAADGLHPNNEGHAFIANTVMNFYGTRLTYGSKTQSIVTNPLQLNLGGTVGSGTAGAVANLKLLVFDNGSQRSGIGVSSGTIEYQANSGAGHKFYIANSEVASIDASGYANTSVGSSNGVNFTNNNANGGATSLFTNNAGATLQSVVWGSGFGGSSMGLLRAGNGMIMWSGSTGSQLAIGTTGNTAMSFYTNSALRGTLSNSGFDLTSLAAGGMVKAAVTTGRLSIATPGTDYGNGTVTNVSVTTANGVSGSVANATTTPAITLTLDTATTYRTVLNSNSKAQDDARFLKLTTAATTYVPVTGSTLNVDMNAKNITNAGQLQAISVVQGSVGTTSLTAIGNGGLVRPSLGQTADYGGIQITNSAGLNNIWSAKLSGTDQLLYSSTSGHRFYTQGTNLTMSIDNIGLTLNKITAGSSGADSIMVHASDGKVKVISPTFYATPTSVVEITGTSQSGAINTIYIPHNAALTTITLPITTTIGSLVQVIGEGAGGWKIAQNSGQFIKGVGITTTTGTGGSIASTDPSCTITLRLVSTGKWAITSSQGTLSPI